MVLPVPRGTPITLAYGVPGNYMAGYHTGVDFGCPVGTPIFSTYDGVVVGTGNVGGSAYGYHQVMIESVYKGQKLRHLYAHMEAFSVSIGQHVAAGQRIGTSGAEGNVTGPHLHYEERVAPFDYWHHVKPVLYTVPAPQEASMLRGIDISAYQDVAPSLNFVPDWVGIKLTEVYKDSSGKVVWYVNPKAAAQAAWARSIKAVVNYYMFGHSAAQVGVSAESQVDFFLSKIPSLGDTDWLSYDWEAYKGAWPSSDEKDRSLSRLQAKQPLHIVALYCNLYFWKQIDQSSNYGDAFWPADPNNPPGQPNVVAPWKVQQFGYVQDTHGANIDGDVLNFPSRAALIAFSKSKQVIVKPPTMTAQQKAAADQQVGLIKHYAANLGSLYPLMTPRGKAARSTTADWKGVA
jgi:hypothetical protein